MPKEYDLSQIEAPPWADQSMVGVPEQTAVKPTASFGELVEAMYFNESLAGTTGNAMAAKAAIFLQDKDPEYNPYVDPQISGLPPEEFSRFVNSRSAGETSIIQEQIRQEREWRDTLANEGLTARSVAAGLLGNAGDMALAIASGGLSAGASAGGRTLVQKSLIAAGKGVVAESAAEAIKHGTQYERTYTETAINVLGAGLFGGLIPVAGAAFRKAVKGHEKEAVEAVGETALKALDNRFDDVEFVDLGDTVGITEPPYKINVGNEPASSYIAKALDATDATPNARATSYEVQEVGQEIRDLFSTNYILNKNIAGEASDSVERRSWAHYTRKDMAVSDTWAAYNEYLKDEGLSFLERQKAGIGMKPNSRSMSFDEFDTLVGQYVQDGADANIIQKQFGYIPNPHVLKAAKGVAKFFADEKAEIISSKLAPDLADPLEGMGYFTRYWKARDIQRNQTEALQDMVRVVKSMEPEIDDAYATSVANEIISTITRQGGVLNGALRSTLKGPLKGRVLKVPDQMVRKWTVQSATEVVQRYVHQVAPRIELAKRATPNPAVSSLKTRIQSLADQIGLPSATKESIAEAKENIRLEVEAVISDYASKYDKDDFLAAAKEIYGDVANKATDVDKLDSMLSALTQLERGDAKRAITGVDALNRIDSKYEGLIRAAREAGNNDRVVRLQTEQAKAIKEVQSAYQVITNSYGSEVDPTGFMSRVVDASMKWSVATKLGRITLNQINDVGTLPMRYGWQATYKASKANWGSLKDGVAKEAKNELRMWAKANDTILSTRMMQMSEMDQTFLKQAGHDVAVDFFYKRMGKVSGFNLWSEHFKMTSGFAASDTIYQHATKGALTDVEQGLMGVVGLSKTTLSKLAKSPWTDVNGIKVPDWNRMDPKLRETVGLAIQQMVEGSTNAPTKGMTPYWFKHPYGRMAGQFKGFLFGVTENTNAFIEQKARLGTPKEKLDSMMGLGAIMSLGALSTALIEWSYDRDVDFTSAKFAMDAIDRSGAAALLMETNSMMEGLSLEYAGSRGFIGARRALGMTEPGQKYYGRSWQEILGGPAAGTLTDVFNVGMEGAATGVAAVSPMEYKPGPDFYRSLMKLAPYNNVVWLTSLPYDLADLAMDDQLPDEPRKVIPQELGQRE